MNLDDMIGKIICGDCLEVMKDIPDKSIDLVLTDPPYGINVIGSIGGSNIVKANLYPPIANDDIKIELSELFRVSKNQIIWGGNYFEMPIKKGWIVWDKKCKNDWNDNFSDGELAWTSFDRNLKIYRKLHMGCLQEGERDVRVHPTQKPLELFRWIIKNYSQENDLILDPFSGSCTTAVACKLLNRRCISIEISPEYCAIGEKRLRNTIPNMELFPEAIK